MSSNDEGLTGSSRVTVFVMFGVVFGYATHHLDERRIGDVAVVGPLTPKVEWGRLWQMARNCERTTAGEKELARWVLAQATRAFVCGSDRIAQLQKGEWKLEPGGRRVRFDTTYANRDQLWTGNLTVEGLTPNQVAERPAFYSA
ncbi:hypothetical protein [Streptomyces inusitatus]|uniref:hypothetical protein n=1 Tax=Streptomyces inusitatus TaxID=68221 RepID=UPI00167DE9B4|nr:hypothetical protein [Streptomyces inusitatus]